MRLAILALTILLVLPAAVFRCNAQDSSEGQNANPWNAELANKAQALFRDLPGVSLHDWSATNALSAKGLRSPELHEKLLLEKVQGHWFAALLHTGDQASLGIYGRFETWRGFVEFLAEKGALVDVWAQGESEVARRISAAEIAGLKRQNHEPPTKVTVTFLDEKTGEPLTLDVEFGFNAAEAMRAQLTAYSTHRSLQLHTREILGAEGGEGMPDAFAQHDALLRKLNEGALTIRETPQLPAIATDLYVACEFETDGHGNFTRLAKIYRDSEMTKVVVRGVQALKLGLAGKDSTREVIGFRRNGVGDRLEPAPNAILGQDTVELRVRDGAEPNPEKWNVVEFGEPEVLKETSLARFALLNAYLERSRKDMAMKRANLGLVAEPIIAALNIGGGVAGIGVPLGEAARIGYNLATFRLISNVPSQRKMRELFAVMAARDRDPAIKTRPEAFLSQRDIDALRREGKKLSNAEIQQYLARMSDEDVLAMLQLARMGMFDARVTTFLNLLTSIFKTSGLSDEPGAIREIFNNAYFSVNGDLNISTMFLAAIGRKDLTPLSGVSLEDLSHGEGPSEAWLQYLSVSLDIRALANTIVRLTKGSYAKKELEKPFPYAPRMDELAAYEFRIFGYPLLMYYKRGLLKLDREAYGRDYAYGLLGVKVVEFFPERENMEAEIRAGRMFPLGLVKVPTAGGWKESDLVVYAHRIPSGKHRGKTALVIYGLKAYQQHSELIARELMRMKQYEQGLREGAVIEQVIWQAESSTESREPVIHTASNSAATVFTPLLSDLLELRRFRFREAWGLPVDGAEIEPVLSRLAQRGIRDSDPLIETDLHLSSFVYRRASHSIPQNVKVTLIPSSADLDRDAAKAAEAVLIEGIRAETASGKSGPVVLLNEAIERGGRLEAGPLLRDEAGNVLGAGVITGEGADKIFRAIDKLPVLERARLLESRFAAAPVTLDLDGSGETRVFLTIEFPLGPLIHTRENPSTGEYEALTYSNGLVRTIVTDRRVVEFVYDAAKVETATYTHANAGDRMRPSRGTLLEETRTIERWRRDLYLREADPHEPITSKLRVNYITGDVTRETYGLFSVPVEIADEHFITRSRYTPDGTLEMAEVFENVAEDVGGDGLAMTRVLHPAAGRLRYELRPQRDAGSADDERLTVLQRTDLLKRLTVSETFDRANFGRKVRRDFSDPFDGQQSFPSAAIWEYQADFHFGLVPVGSVALSSSGTRYSDSTTLSYNPVNHRLMLLEVSHTGLRQTNTYDARWESPITTETAHRAVTHAFNVDGTQVRSSAIARSNGEVVEESSGSYDPARKVWVVTRQTWYGPGVPGLATTNVYSAFGRLILSRIGDLVELRPGYRPDGIEETMRTYYKTSTNVTYDVLVRQEKDYAWEGGRRTARVIDLSGGQTIAEYRVVADEAGRTVEKSVRPSSSFELRTVIAYEGDTERASVSEVFQNGILRTSYRSLGVLRSVTGEWVSRVVGVPVWGLTFTNTYLLVDPRQRQVSAEYENGNQARTVAWFGETAVPQRTEVLDRHGVEKERYETRIVSATNGDSLFVTTRFRTGRWGESVAVEEKAFWAGTDVPLYSDRREERIFFDPTEVYEAPAYSIDLRRRSGLMALVDGVLRSNVTAVFTSEMSEVLTSNAPSTSAEAVLVVSGVRLDRTFRHNFFRRTMDRAGNLISEDAGMIRNLSARPYTDEALLAEVARAGLASRTEYLYEPAVLQEIEPGAPPDRAAFRFVMRPTAASESHSVNRSGWREWPTRIRSYRVARPPADTEGPLFIERQRLSSPMWLGRNPYVIGSTNVWTSWTGTYLSDGGEGLFDFEMLVDAQGEPSASIAHKRNIEGSPADRIVYYLPRPPPDAWRQLDSVAVGTGAPRMLWRSGDLSKCFFLGFYLEGVSAATAGVRVRDSSGTTIEVTNSSVRLAATNGIPFWPTGTKVVCWLPNEDSPEIAAEIVVPGMLQGATNAFIICVPELAQAGLDVSRISSMELTLGGTVGQDVKVTELYHFGVPDAVVLPPASYGRREHRVQQHSNGLVLHQFLDPDRPVQDKPGPLDWRSVLMLGGAPIGFINSRSVHPHYPTVVFFDSSGDFPRPLYRLAAEDGRFMSLYQQVDAGDTHVYTLEGGFATPRRDTHRAGVLDDELSPGVLEFGRDYDVVLSLAKGNGPVANALARLRNRCAASAFAWGATTLGRSLWAPVIKSTSPGHSSQTGALQARDIDGLPTLAEVLLLSSQVPWTTSSPSRSTGTAVSEGQNDVVRSWLTQLGRRYVTNSIVPTFPGTPVERFVDTVREAALIELAVKVREPVLAGDMLSFYWGKSQGGNTALHASYDLWTGASLAYKTHYSRPVDSEITASVQLSVAQAAFCLGTATGDRNALTFGSNLVNLLLSDFRSDSAADWPRGLSESPHTRILRKRGVTLWPRANSFRVGCNARAFLLFSRLSAQADTNVFGLEWKQTMRAAALEQAAWLTNRVMPHVQRAGVVPQGMFEVQDVHDRTTTLALDRWTTTDDWLAFVEALVNMGLPASVTSEMLDNLARVHGVEIDGIWGLDWAVPLQRPDAISIELTRKFQTVASKVGYNEPADFARQNLALLAKGDTWPIAHTGTEPEGPLTTGDGNVVHSGLTRAGPTGITKTWPASPAYGHPAFQSDWLTGLRVVAPMSTPENPPRDFMQFLSTLAMFYLAIVGTAMFWWMLGYVRHRRHAKLADKGSAGLLVSHVVMQKAEERWAKRVLGMRVPTSTARTRYSNAAIEQNFLIQLRSIHKLTLEWRRVTNDWAEDDPRLAEDGTDEWLNGLDEFCAMVGIYTRWVIKAGRKDGLQKQDVLHENEDSNHLWARLVMYFSEAHAELIKMISDFKANPKAAAVLGLNDRIELVLRTIGLRARPTPFDARVNFDAPATDSALDLIIIQTPGANLERIAEELEQKLGIPTEHFVQFLKGYKSFKRREEIYPIHPYLLEAAKLFPHFLLMGLAGLVWYNIDLGGLRIYPYLRELALQMAFEPRSLFWAVPLGTGFFFSLLAYSVEVYRYRSAPGSSTRGSAAIETDVASLLSRQADISTPSIRLGRWWDPSLYKRVGWFFRAVGLMLLSAALFQVEAPSFAIFMFLKVLVGMTLFTEAAGLLIPLVISPASAWLEDYASARPSTGGILRFLNQLNIGPTRPASLIWLSIKYHFQPSLPTGGPLPMLKAMAAYLLHAGVFFVTGSYMFKQALELWFQESYRMGSTVGLLFGAFLFWITIYLLRCGLFVLIAAGASLFALYPIKFIAGVAAVGWLAAQWISPTFIDLSAQYGVAAALITVGTLILMSFESELLAWLRKRVGRSRGEHERAALDSYRLDPNRALAVVYMSGDELSFHKLTPELLIARLRVLRDQLGSGGVKLLYRLQELPDDAELTRRFSALYDLEKRSKVTLWHPLQLALTGEVCALRPELELNLVVDGAIEREELLATWHLRRWLVTMMSTAGHSQDTGINLVDVAFSLAREGLGANTVFYLIQNKYDNSDHNRPSQLAYDQGELGQRDKLAALLMEVAPGARAYSLNDWTPFGFKAGGLVAMDLVHEESLKLTNMLLLDRNANVHDLDSLMYDLKFALANPGVVIVIPGRSTTNTLTPVGQSSQLIEEGQRALTRGVMSLGGEGAEALGTGWGNIQAVYYGRVQTALCNVNTSRMPLTTATRRNASFGDRCEGLIGFGPHAVGISEDIWGVAQAAHNAIGLGYKVRFARSRALWHKIRETWSHAEWLSAFPRWSGGYFQLAMDPLMQQINDGGSASVFAKELRAGGGRFFLSSPFALLSIVLMPLAIIWDLSPFIQILVLLWNVGLIMNQVLTALGLVSYLESTGFNRVSAVAGAVIAGGLAGWKMHSPSLALPIAALGFLGGGFAMGVGRWLYYRGRDVIVFGPQLVIHTLGQVVRQSLEFVLSGASPNDATSVNMAFRSWVGPREDRPFEPYPNLVNLRTVVWGVGLAVLVLNLFALANLDFLNVLLLLPSLMFSISALVGPFLTHPKPGKDLGSMVVLPKVLGWGASLAFYLVMAAMVARGGMLALFALILGVAVFARVAWGGLKYVGYPRLLRSLAASLRRKLIAEGVSDLEAATVTDRVVREAIAGPAKANAAIEAVRLSPAARAALQVFITERVIPVVLRPKVDAEHQALQPRFACEFERSFVLGLFTFVWFFVVPMPGLLVFKAPSGYGLAMLPSTVLWLAFGAIAAVLLSGLASLLLEKVEIRSRRGLGTRIAARYAEFQTALRDGKHLSPIEISSLYAMFTDIQTYYDQRSYAYVKRTLGLVEQALKTGREFRHHGT